MCNHTFVYNYTDTITPTLNPTQLSSPPLQTNPSPSNPLPSKCDLNKDDLYQLRRTIDKSIEQVYDKLDSAIGGSLPELVQILFEDGLVSRELISSPNYDDMMKSFASTMEWDTNVEDLEKDFTKFIRALDKIGGAARKAGEKILLDLKTSVKERFDFPPHSKAEHLPDSNTTNRPDDHTHFIRSHRTYSESHVSRNPQLSDINVSESLRKYNIIIPSTC